MLQKTQIQQLMFNNCIIILNHLRTKSWQDSRFIGQLRNQGRSCSEQPLLLCSHCSPWQGPLATPPYQRHSALASRNRQKCFLQNKNCP